MNFGDDANPDPGLHEIAAETLCRCGHPWWAHVAGVCKTRAGDCSCIDFKVPPQRLADAGDHCTRCHRPLNVAEPIYCGPGGGVYCAACHDATEQDRGAPWPCARCGAPAGTTCDLTKHDAHVNDFDVAFDKAPTSVMMRAVAVALEALAARMLSAGQNSGAVNCNRLVGALRARAELLQAIGRGEVPNDKPASWEQVLRAIGEVQS